MSIDDVLMARSHSNKKETELRLIFKLKVVGRTGADRVISRHLDERPQEGDTPGAPDLALLVVLDVESQEWSQ